MKTTLTRPRDLSGYVCNVLVFPIVVDEKSSPAKGTPKKMKVEAYKLSKEQKALIKDDELNKKLWDEAMESLSLGPVRTGQRLHYIVTSNLSLLSLLMSSFRTVALPEQSGGSFPVHLLPRSCLSAHHHRMPTQRLQGEGPKPQMRAFYHNH